MDGTSTDIVGAGWSFPARLTGSGAVRLVTGSTEIDQAIHLILATAPGERPMRPEFGCRIHDFVFAPINATTSTLIEQEVRAALERWEPRIDVEEVVITGDAADAALLYVTLSYRIRTTNDARNLVFPFYTIPPATPV